VGGQQLQKPLCLRTALTPAKISQPPGAKNNLLASGKLRLEAEKSERIIDSAGVYAQTPDDQSGVSAPFSLPGPEADGPASQSLFRSYFQALGASWVQVTSPEPPRESSLLTTYWSESTISS
jgi:hypothetical protein